MAEIERALRVRTKVGDLAMAKVYGHASKKNGNGIGSVYGHGPRPDSAVLPRPQREQLNVCAEEQELALVDTFVEQHHSRARAAGVVPTTLRLHYTTVRVLV